MSELSPIAQALLGGVEAPDRKVPCRMCGELTEIPGFLWEAVKLWNRRECELADEAARSAGFVGKIELIKSSEIAACDACAPKVRAQLTAEYMLEISTTQIYLRELRAGRYNPESLTWLRKHGHTADVIQVLSEEGNKR
jgi:hypothetical protein